MVRHFLKNTGIPVDFTQGVFFAGYVSTAFEILYAVLITCWLVVMRQISIGH